jgi:hypothetical protein
LSFLSARVLLHEDTRVSCLLNKKTSRPSQGGLLIRILNNIKHWRKDTAFFRHLQIFEAFFFRMDEKKQADTSPGACKTFEIKFHFGRKDTAFQ